MFTPDDYKNQPRNWKPTPFNFRGNPENKQLVKDFMKANNFANEGEALDYILQAFTLTFGKANPLTAQVSEKEAEIQNLKAKLVAAEKDSESTHNMLANEIKDLQLEIKRISANPSVEFPDAYITLKSATEKQLPVLFQRTEEVIPLSNENFIELLVDYCERDPSKEFPFEPVARKIVERTTTNHE